MNEKSSRRARRTYADLLHALAQAASARLLAGLDVAGDDFDQFALAQPQVSGETKLTDQHDLAAVEIDRQHADDATDAQKVTRQLPLAYRRLMT